jgi:uncharacterized protein YpbB
MINATSKSSYQLSHQPSHFVLSALECMEYLIDGIMLVSQLGEVIYMNQTAAQMCQTLNSSLPSSPLPQALWQTCQTLVKHDPTTLDRANSHSIEAMIQSYRVRVQCVLSARLASPCFMVRIEDQQQSLEQSVLQEIQQYGLTQREAEVWKLKRENLSRQEIAKQLFISIDTVKKHLCNIQLKRHNYCESVAQS